MDYRSFLKILLSPKTKNFVEDKDLDFWDISNLLEIGKEYFVFSKDDLLKLFDQQEEAFFAQIARMSEDHFDKKQTVH